MRILSTLLLAAIAALPAAAQTAPPTAKKSAPAKPAPAATAKKSALDKPTLEAYLRHLNLWPEQVKVVIDDPKPSPIPGFSRIDVHLSAGQSFLDEIYYVSKDGQKVLRGSAFDINKSPFAEEMDLLKNDLQPSFGTPGAPLVMTVFSDFQCPVCKEEANTLRNQLAKDPKYKDKIRVYFRDFPLDAIHPWARAAAIAGRCVYRMNPAAFWDYHDFIFENQQLISGKSQAEMLPFLESKVMEFAKAKGLDTLQLKRCMDTKATEGEVNQSVALGRSLQIMSTPTLFLNGRRLGNLPWQNLQLVLDYELNHYAKTGEGGEKCCEVKIPSLVK